MKPCICWQGPYLPPSSLLSQYKEEAIGAALFFTASLMLRGEAELVHPQLSKLVKSILYGYRNDFWNGKTSKCGNDRDRQTQLCSIAWLLFVISLCVWSLERESEWSLSKLSSIYALCLNQKVAIKSAGQRGVCFDNTLHGYYTGSQCLVFPWNLLLSSQTSCVKPVHNKISWGSISCTAYKYSLITL